MVVVGFGGGVGGQSIAGSRADFAAFDSSCRFSAQFGSFGRGPKLCHSSGNGSAHVLRSRRSADAFPRSQVGLPKLASQDQLVLHHGDHLAPALKLLWRAQARVAPQQGLRVLAVAMFLRVAPFVAWGHLLQRERVLCDPQKPTCAWVTRLVAGTVTDHANEREFDATRLTQMQPPPARHRDGMPGFILPLPLFIWLSMRAGIIATSSALHPSAAHPACPSWGERANRRPDCECSARACHRPGLPSPAQREHSHTSGPWSQSDGWASAARAIAVGWRPLRWLFGGWQYALDRVHRSNCSLAVARGPLPKTASRS